MTPKNDMMTLIERYLEAVARLSKGLAQSCEVGSLYIARRDQRIPRSGTFGEDGEFNFHGIGCSIDDGSTSVNFDFFGEGRTDGFDAWRLHTFAEDNVMPSNFTMDTSRDALVRELEGLVESGLVVPVPASKLFMLASAA